MNFKQRFSKAFKILLITKVIDPFIRLLFRLSRFEIEGLDSFIEATSTTPALLALWHERLLIMPYLLEKKLAGVRVCAVISKSRDGELLECLKSSLPNVETIRVSHDSRHGSLKAMLEALKELKVIIITPDGPQGPWKEIKPGLLQASAWTKAQIWGLNWSCKHTLSLPTQDKMKLPLPFQKITLSLECVGIYDPNEPELAQEVKRSLG